MKFFLTFSFFLTGFCPQSFENTRGGTGSFILRPSCHHLLHGIRTYSCIRRYNSCIMKYECITTLSGNKLRGHNIFPSHVLPHKFLLKTTCPSENFTCHKLLFFPIFIYSGNLLAGHPIYFYFYLSKAKQRCCLFDYYPLD